MLPAARVGVVPDLASPYGSPAPSGQDSRPLTVRRITAADHGRFLAEHPESSFLQNPQWPGVKIDWRGDSLGFFDGQNLKATALVLFRRLPVPVPVLKNRSLAYIAEGPVFDSSAVQLESVLVPLVQYLKSRGAFLVRVGLPGIVNRWDGSEVRKALAAGTHHSVTDLTPLHTDPAAEEIRSRLQALGWQAPSTSEEFEAGQPQFQARIPLQPELDFAADGTRVEPNKNGESPALEAALNRMDSTSRRQTRKSTRSELTVSVGTVEDLPAWQALYEETAARDGFTGRPLAYFQRMFAELNSAGAAGSAGTGGSEGGTLDSAADPAVDASVDSSVNTAVDTECTLYLAHFGEQLLAAAIYVRQGQFGWYVYGASSSEERKRYAPRALQLRQIQDSLAAGCTWFDLGGMSPSLDPEYELAGLTRFKTTMGADVVQTLGEWDYPVNRVLARGFNLYMSRRG
ncbi:peptidoglycan bridge formation glycyltransferase FemA/FemB family protein [Cellulosimicrobium funkei]|nr:peptidoglycan bridge formation glycyltransferase FemA/FemB family protein [Cellulosimicrobium funkei]